MCIEILQSSEQCFFRWIFLGNKDEDLVENIVSFLDFRSVANASVSCLSFLNICSDDRIWHKLSQKRWHITYKLHHKKICGGSSWSQVYRNFAWAQRMPKGLYTNKFHIIFARGRCEGVDAWVTVGHTADCKVTRSIPVREPPGSRVVIKAIELRLVIQNVWHGEARLRPMNVKLVHRQRRAGEYLESSPVDVIAPELIALDGKAPLEDEARLVAKTGEIVLRPLQFAVIRLFVQCPYCTFETDFLAKTLALVAPVQVTDFASNTGTSETKTIFLGAKFVDENVLWKHYAELPGGFLVLADRQGFEM